MRKSDFLLQATLNMLRAGDVYPTNVWKHAKEVVSNMEEDNFKFEDEEPDNK